MRRLFCFAFALMSVVASMAQGSFTINGHIDGGLEGMKVYLRYGDVCYDENKEVLDSAVLHEGNFVLKGRLSSPVLCTVFFEDPIKCIPPDGSVNSKFQAELKSKDRHEKIDKVLSLFVEDAILSVQAFYDSLCLKKQFQNHYSEKDNRILPAGITGGFGTCRSAVVKGSPSHDLLMRFLNDAANQELFQKRASLVYQAPFTTGNAARAMDGLMKELKERVLQFVKGHPPGEVTGFILLHMLDEYTCAGSMPDLLHWTTVDDIKQLTAPFAEMKDKGPIVQELLQKVPGIAKGAIGAPFIDFVFRDTSGVQHALSEYAGKGKYVLVDLWASWCSGCRNMIPHVKEAYRSYHSRGLDVISVSIDTKKENWIKAVKKEAMPWPQLAANLMSDAELKKGGKLAEYKESLSPDDGNMLGVYMSPGVPLYLLFDPKGQLVSRFSLIPFIDKPLADLYGAPFPK